MTEVAYGQFFEAFEDAAAPLAESNEQEKQPLSSKNWAMMNFELVRKFFRAMETVNNSQLENSESSMSLATSSNSFNSLSSVSLNSPSNKGNGLTPQNVFGAFQTVALNNYGSTNSLASFDGSTPEDRVMLPLIVQKMLMVFDEFMHNHNYVEDTGKEAAPVSPKDFPKFC